MSLIHYKFKSAKDYNSVEFEGLSLSLFELKRDILIDNKLKGTDFDIIISNAQSNEDYHDDSQLIPKNTSVYVRRVPARVGGTSAQHYLTEGPVASTQQIPKRMPESRSEAIHIGSTGGKSKLSGSELLHPDELSGGFPMSLEGVLPGESEEDKLKALFDQTSMQWQQHNSASSALGSTTNRAGSHHRSNNPTGKPTSATYICHRCGIKGHYVQNCPSINDKKQGGTGAPAQPKVKRTTGIPRSFLKNIDAIPEGKGAMITNEGELVVAQTNDTAWKKFQFNQRGAGMSAEELRELAPVPSDLKCHLCNKLVIDAVSVPCCKKLYCHECITEELLNKQFVCPGCQSNDIVPDQLIGEPNIRSQVQDHLRIWATTERQGSGVENNSALEELEAALDINNNGSSNIPDPLISSSSTSAQPNNNIPVESGGSLTITQHMVPVVDSSEDREFNSLRRPIRKTDQYAYSEPTALNQPYFNNNTDSTHDIPVLHHNEQHHQANNEETASGIDMPPPLRWTPNGGISGHITIPPIEALNQEGSTSNLDDEDCLWREDFDGQDENYNRKDDDEQEEEEESVARDRNQRMNDRRSRSRSDWENRRKNSVPSSEYDIQYTNSRHQPNSTRQQHPNANRSNRDNTHRSNIPNRRSQANNNHRGRRRRDGRSPSPVRNFNRSNAASRRNPNTEPLPPFNSENNRRNAGPYRSRSPPPIDDGNNNYRRGGAESDNYRNRNSQDNRQRRFDQNSNNPRRGFNNRVRSRSPNHRGRDFEGSGAVGNTSGRRRSNTDQYSPVSRKGSSGNNSNNNPNFEALGGGNNSSSPMKRRGEGNHLYSRRSSIDHSPSNNNNYQGRHENDNKDDDGYSTNRRDFSSRHRNDRRERGSKNNDNRFREENNPRDYSRDDNARHQNYSSPSHQPPASRRSDQSQHEPVSAVNRAQPRGNSNSSPSPVRRGGSNKRYRDTSPNAKSGVGIVDQQNRSTIMDRLGTTKRGNNNNLSTSQRAPSPGASNQRVASSDIFSRIGPTNNNNVSNLNSRLGTNRQQHGNDPEHTAGSNKRRRRQNNNRSYQSGRGSGGGGRNQNQNEDNSSVPAVSGSIKIARTTKR